MNINKPDLRALLSSPEWWAQVEAILRSPAIKAMEVMRNNPGAAREPFTRENPPPSSTGQGNVIRVTRWSRP